MPDNNLSQRVIACIAKTQHIAPETIAIDSSFEQLGIDSLDGINILFAVENEFNINVPDDAARSIRTVRQMVEGVEKLIDGQSSAQGEPQ